MVLDRPFTQRGKMFKIDPSKKKAPKRKGKKRKKKKPKGSTNLRTMKAKEESAISGKRAYTKKETRSENVSGSGKHTFSGGGGGNLVVNVYAGGGKGGSSRGGRAGASKPTKAEKDREKARATAERQARESDSRRTQAEMRTSGAEERGAIRTQRQLMPFLAMGQNANNDGGGADQRAILNSHLQIEGVVKELTGNMGRVMGELGDLKQRSRALHILLKEPKAKKEKSTAPRPRGETPDREWEEKDPTPRREPAKVGGGRLRPEEPLLTEVPLKEGGATAPEKKADLSLTEKTASITKVAEEIVEEVESRADATLMEKAEAEKSVKKPTLDNWGYDTPEDMGNKLILRYNKKGEPIYISLKSKRQKGQPQTPFVYKRRRKDLIDRYAGGYRRTTDEEGKFFDIGEFLPQKYSNQIRKKAELSGKKMPDPFASTIYIEYKIDQDVVEGNYGEEIVPFYDWLKTKRGKKIMKEMMEQYNIETQKEVKQILEVPDYITIFNTELPVSEEDEESTDYTPSVSQSDSGGSEEIFSSDDDFDFIQREYVRSARELMLKEHYTAKQRITLTEQYLDNLSNYKYPDLPPHDAVQRSLKPSGLVIRTANWDDRNYEREKGWGSSHNFKTASEMIGIPREALLKRYREIVQIDKTIDMVLKSNTLTEDRRNSLIKKKAEITRNNKELYDIMKNSIILQLESDKTEWGTGRKRNMYYEAVGTKYADMPKSWGYDEYSKGHTMNAYSPSVSDKLLPLVMKYIEGGATLPIRQAYLTEDLKRLFGDEYDGIDFLQSSNEKIKKQNLLRSKIADIEKKEGFEAYKESINRGERSSWDDASLLDPETARKEYIEKMRNRRKVLGKGKNNMYYQIVSNLPTEKWGGERLYSDELLERALGGNPTKNYVPDGLWDDFKRGVRTPYKVVIDDEEVSLPSMKVAYDMKMGREVGYKDTDGKKKIGVKNVPLGMMFGNNYNDVGKSKMNEFSGNPEWEDLKTIAKWGKKDAEREMKVYIIEREIRDLSGDDSDMEAKIEPIRLKKYKGGVVDRGQFKKPSDFYAMRRYFDDDKGAKLDDFGRRYSLDNWSNVPTKQITLSRLRRFPKKDIESNAQRLIANVFKIRRGDRPEIDAQFHEGKYNTLQNKILNKTRDREKRFSKLEKETFPITNNELEQIKDEIMRRPESTAIADSKYGKEYKLKKIDEEMEKRTREIKLSDDLRFADSMRNQIGIDTFKESEELREAQQYKGAKAGVKFSRLKEVGEKDPRRHRATDEGWRDVSERTLRYEGDIDKIVDTARKQTYSYYPEDIEEIGQAIKVMDKTNIDEYRNGVDNLMDISDELETAIQKQKATEVVFLDKMKKDPSRDKESDRITRERASERVRILSDNLDNETQQFTRKLRKREVEIDDIINAEETLGKFMLGDRSIEMVRKVPVMRQVRGEPLRERIRESLGSLIGDYPKDKYTSLKKSQEGGERDERGKYFDDKERERGSGDRHKGKRRTFAVNDDKKILRGERIFEELEHTPILYRAKESGARAGLPDIKKVRIKGNLFGSTIGSFAITELGFSDEDIPARTFSGSSGKITRGKAYFDADDSGGMGGSGGSQSDSSGSTRAVDGGESGSSEEIYREDSAEVKEELTKKKLRRIRQKSRRELGDQKGRDKRLNAQQREYVRDKYRDFIQEGTEHNDGYTISKEEWAEKLEEGWWVEEKSAKEFKKAVAKGNYDSEIDFSELGGMAIDTDSGSDFVSSPDEEGISDSS